MNQAVPHFFHGDPLELVGDGARPFEARERATPQLFGALGGNVDEKKAAGDRGSGLRRLGPSRGVLCVGVLCHVQ